MIIYDSPKKGKIQALTLITACLSLILGSTGVLGIWKLYSLQSQKHPISIEYTSAFSSSSPFAVVEPPETEKSTSTQALPVKNYVASRGGVSYYLVSCSGANRISEKNKIWFETKEEAERFGYKPSKSCKGI